MIGFVLFKQQQTIEQQNAAIAYQTAQKEAAQAEINSKIQEEKLLSQDNDGDGLNLREEQLRGTSDYNSDTDGDSVPDKYDEHPLGGDRNIVKYLKWDYITPWTWELDIKADVITYYEQKPRPTWHGDYSYYSEFIETNDPGIKRLASGLRSTINEYGQQWDYYNQVMFVVSMVQQMHYASDILVGFDDYTKFPMQTLNDGTGDCEDMSILTAAILKELNFDVKLIFLSIPDGRTHVAIGVWGIDNYPGTYWSKDNRKYFYIETTNLGWDFGEYPTEFSGSTGRLIDIK